MAGKTETKTIFIRMLVIAAMAIGFAAYKAAIACSYRTAMGSVTETCGYVSDVDFMIVVNAASFITAIVVFLLFKRRIVQEGSIAQSPAIVMLSIGMLASRKETASALPPEIVVVLLGMICGFSIVVLCIVWIDALVRLENARVALWVMVLGLCLKEVFYACAKHYAGVAFELITVGLLLFSAIALFAINRNKPAVEFKRMPEQDRYAFVKSFIGLFILVGIVGIIHTTVLGSSAEAVVGQVNMNLVGGLSSLVAGAIAFLMGWNISAVRVGKAAFPCILVALSLLPLLGEHNGSMVGFLSIFCYEIYSKIFLLYILCECYRTHCSALELSCLFSGGTGGSLAIGLSIGLALNAFSAGYDLSLLALLAVAAVYPIALGTMVLYRRNEPLKKIIRTQKGSEHEKTDAAKQAVDSEFACRAIAKASGLTPRETEVLALLAKGRSAKHIADDLCIAENTAWVHIKNVYSKTGVHGKQGLIDAVESAHSQMSSSDESHY